MKPFHRDNTLFFFKLYPRTNGSFFQWKDRIWAFILRGLYLGNLSHLTPFVISELLRGWGGGREVDRSLQPAPGGDPRPGSGDAWSLVGGIMKGQPLYLGSQWGRSLGNHSARTLSKSKAGAVLPSAFQHIINTFTGSATTPLVQLGNLDAKIKYRHAAPNIVSQSLWVPHSV